MFISPLPALGNPLLDLWPLLSPQPQPPPAEPMHPRGMHLAPSRARASWREPHTWREFSPRWQVQHGSRPIAEVFHVAPSLSPAPVRRKCTGGGAKRRGGLGSQPIRRLQYASRSSTSNFITERMHARGMHLDTSWTRGLCAPRRLHGRETHRAGTHTRGWSQWRGQYTWKNFLEDLQSQEYATVAEEEGDVAYRSPPIRKLGPCLLSFGLFRGDILPHPQARNYPKIHRSFGGGRCCVPSARTLCTSSEVCLLKKALILQLKQKAEELSCHSSRTEFLRASSSQHNLRDSSGLCSESFIHLDASFEIDEIVVKRRHLIWSQGSRNFHNLAGSKGWCLRSCEEGTFFCSFSEEAHFSLSVVKGTSRRGSCSCVSFVLCCCSAEKEEAASGVFRDRHYGSEGLFSFHQTKLSVIDDDLLICMCCLSRATEQSNRR